jgi:hypothetical protein
MKNQDKRFLVFFIEKSSIDDSNIIVGAEYLHDRDNATTLTEADDHFQDATQLWLDDAPCGAARRIDPQTVIVRAV